MCFCGCIWLPFLGQKIATMLKVVATLAALIVVHAASPYKDTLWPHWEALEAQFGRIEAHSCYVISIPNDWNGALTMPGGLFWAYIRSRVGPHVTIHYNRVPQVTTFRVYGNAWGCPWVLKVIHEALPLGIASMVFGSYGGIAPTLPTLPDGMCGM